MIAAIAVCGLLSLWSLMRAMARADRLAERLERGEGRAR